MQDSSIETKLAAVVDALADLERHLTGPIGDGTSEPHPSSETDAERRTDSPSLVQEALGLRSSAVPRPSDYSSAVPDADTPAFVAFIRGQGYSISAQSVILNCLRRKESEFRSENERVWTQRAVCAFIDRKRPMDVLPPEIAAQVASVTGAATVSQLAADLMKYAAELDHATNIIGDRTPIGLTKGIGRLEVAAALDKLFLEDDRTFADVVWMQSNGFGSNLSKMHTVYYHASLPIAWERATGHLWLAPGARIYAIIVNGISTRGQVRRMIAALKGE